MDDKNKLNFLIAEKRRREEEEPARYFIPTMKQEEWIQQKNFIRVFCAGNGAGKSAIGAQAIVNLTMPKPINPYFETDFYKNFKRPSRGRIISNPTAILKNIVPALKKWFPKDSYVTTKDRKVYESDWTIKSTGSSFDIMSVQQDREEFESVTLDWCLIDEPIDKDRFNATIARFRFGGVIFFTLTPLADASVSWLFETYTKGEDRQFEFTLADIESACIEHSPRGFLKHSAIIQMLKNYDPDELMARRDGKFMQLAGIVYRLFSPHAHVLKENIPIPNNVTIYHVLDPHDKKPFAMIWAWVDSRGDVTVFDEYPHEEFHQIKSSSLELKDYANVIKNTEDKFPCKVEWRLIDPNFGNTKSWQSARTIRQEFYEDYNLSFENANDQIEAGHLQVKQYLNYDFTRAISNTNKPKLYILPKCRNTITALSHYAYKSNENVLDQKFKDFADCLRYLLMANPEHEIKVGNSDFKYEGKSMYHVGR